MTPEDLKEKLRGIVQQNYEVTRAEAQHLLPNMLHHLGNPDPELRDRFIYATLATWITQDTFNTDELKTLLQNVLNDKHLFYCIGEENTDSVFTRSFSVLLIPPLLGTHREKSFLSHEEVQNIWQKLKDYLLNEQDLRGYVRGKGWVHAVAHAADALDELALCSETTKETLTGILELTASVASTEKSVYTHGEDERLSFAVVNILKRSELTLEEKVGWLESFTSQVQQAGPMPDPEGYQKFINIKHFLRTLYFYVLQSDVDDKAMVLEKLQTLLKQFSEL
jgi:Protein of unknown function (DUF2785)